MSSVLSDSLFASTDCKLDEFCNDRGLFLTLSLAEPSSIFPVLAEAERSSSTSFFVFRCFGLGDTDHFSLARLVYLTSGLEGGVPSDITRIC